ncbi:condensation domain-containing protein [Plantactinospora mayteni]|uniref:Condensation domain-containing protein n=1 Tax=Plantactinospora mayteni TaxID=566021 RepID=A0ABQ4EID1_9ACTN|nr:condensation domain-containing protein [Plantactinospora mayteni]GIG94469.1 hypothetical protein Pma05_10420 [Plantactinospora mayteni]
MSDVGDVPSYAQERRVRTVCAARQHGHQPSGKTLALACVLPERADIAALEEAVAGFVARHSALRYRFRHRDGMVTVRRVTPRPIRCAVTEAESPPNSVEAVEQLVRAEVDRPFDVLGWPLLRAGVIQSSRPVFHLSMDHLVADGWSLTVAHRDIEALYRAAVTGSPADLPEPGDFAAFATAQRRRYTEGPALDQQVTAVQRLLGGRPVEPAFPVDARPWDLAAGRYVRIDLLDRAEAEAFTRRCRTVRATAFMGVLAAVGTAMHEATGQQEVGMLVAMHNRDTPPVAGSVGWYANMLPLYFPATARFDHTLRSTRAALLAAIEHHELPIARVLDTTPAGHYSGAGDQYPLCFVSFSDDRTMGPTGTAAGPQGAGDGWQRVHLAPAHRLGYGIWISLTDTGLLAVVASPRSLASRDHLAAFETTLADVLRRVATEEVR